MAFVRIENKTREIEVIVFPKVYAVCGAKLLVDNVVRVQGQIDAKNKDGSMGSDAKIKAETVEVISDSVLDNYKSTGTRLAMPWNAAKREEKDYKKSKKLRVDSTKSKYKKAKTPYESSTAVNKKKALPELNSEREIKTKNNIEN
mgnify:CR=1 FL=1